MQTLEQSPQCVLKSFNEVSARRKLFRAGVTDQNTDELRSAYKVTEFGKRYWKAPRFRCFNIHSHLQTSALRFKWTRSAV